MSEEILGRWAYRDENGSKFLRELTDEELEEIYQMANTTAALDSTGPADGDMVEIRMSGYVAREFVAMLNMNKIRDARGNLVVFSWQQVGQDWMLSQTTWTPEYQHKEAS